MDEFYFLVDEFSEQVGVGCRQYQLVLQPRFPCQVLKQRQITALQRRLVLIRQGPDTHDFDPGRLFKERRLDYGNNRRDSGNHCN